MTNNSLLGDAAVSSLSCSNQNPGSIESYNKVQQFHDVERSMVTVPMDYEFILNNQTEQNEDTEESPPSKNNWEKICDDAGVCSEKVCSDPFYNMDCGKDVPVDLYRLFKENVSSNIAKIENFDMKLKLKEEDKDTDKDCKMLKSLKGLLNAADFEANADCGFVQEHTGERVSMYDSFEKFSNNNNKMSSRRNNILDVVGDVEDCYPAIQYNQMASSYNRINEVEGSDNDFFDITTSGTEQDLHRDIKMRFPLEASGSISKYPLKIKSAKCPSAKASEQMKYGTIVSTKVEENEIDDNLNFDDNDHLKSEPEKCGTAFGDEMSLLQQSKDCGNKNRKEADKSSIERDFSQHFETNYFVDNLSMDSSSDLLTPVSEKKRMKQVTNGHNYKGESNIFQPDICDNSVRFLGDIDGLIGLYPSGKISDVAMTSLNEPSNLESNSIHSKASFGDSKPGSYSVAQGIAHVSEHTSNTESIDRSGQKKRTILSSKLVLTQHNPDSPTSPVTSFSVLKCQQLLNEEPGMNCTTESPSSNQKNKLPIETLPLVASAISNVIPSQVDVVDSPLVASVISNVIPCQDDVVDSERGSYVNLTSSIQKSVSSGNDKHLDSPSESEGSIVPTQKLHASSESLKNGEIQQSACKVTMCSSSTPDVPQALSRPLTSSDMEIVTASALEFAKNPLSPAQNSLPAESNSLSQAPATSPGFTLDNSKHFTNGRHIKSIFNTYVNHGSKSDVYSNEDINNMANDLALILRGTRKRSHSDKLLCTTANHLTPTPAKRLFLVEPCSTVGHRGQMKESKSDMDVADSSIAGPSLQTNMAEQEQGAAIMLCKVCDTSNPGYKSIRCRNSHVICNRCLEDEIRLVMVSEKMHLSCPEKSCKAAIATDSLSSVMPSFVVDLLRDNLNMKERKVSAKAFKKMQGLIICPRCSCPGLLDDCVIQFVCATCNSSCCRYCKAAWTHYEEHEGCLLLSFVGTECLKDITKLPLNWKMNITPFNKNFVQVDVPLSSPEGSMVAAYFAKTSSVKSHVVQIFRIQNWKLWEKYVLKRRHVEEEIGAAELKEKFLFHGTKAENIVSICGEGFDMRVPTANGAVLGKGIYFSVNARYSEKYAGESGILFLARVICGWSQNGQRQMTRPQYHSTSKRMYDSCVDNVSSPTMFTIFDNSQCYPEYLIKIENSFTDL